jgi:hypothetical protein
VANLWHAKKSKANVGIQSFTNYVTLKDWDEFSICPYSMHQPSLYVLQCVVSKASENELKSNVH